MFPLILIHPNYSSHHVSQRFLDDVMRIDGVFLPSQGLNEHLIFIQSEG